MIRGFAVGFSCLPAIHAFGSFVPVGATAVEIEDDDGIAGFIEQCGLLGDLGLGGFAHSALCNRICHRSHELHGILGQPIAREHGHDANHSALNEKRETDEGLHPFAQHPFLVDHIRVGDQVVAYLRHALAGNLPHLEHAYGNAAVLPIRVGVHPGTGLQLQGVIVAVQRPNARIGTVHVLDDGLHGPGQENLQVVAIGQSEGHVRAQSELSTLPGPHHFALAPVCDVPEDHDRANGLVRFAQRRGGVLDGEWRAVPAFEFIRVTDKHSAVDECRSGEQIILSARQTVYPELVQHHADRLANQIPRGPVGQPGASRIDEGDRPLHIEAEDAFACGGQKQFVALVDPVDFLL